MATGVIPFPPRKRVRVERRQLARDPASHGVELALELQIAEASGEAARGRSAAAAGRRRGIARAFAWLHALRFVGQRG